ncbi:transporter substrate-binding domain-containing protein [Aurantimonas sp. Leaf443]|uniref:transporter substrate-binding domain-containing protein n=1 Tax=Aurantimonas sp. Leaf443 TaxID=1736378 RepID=UPI0006FDDB2D|nr:transporter substrate-binding domain-containing protein [Aurantimonas sp. Leaf443]KQT84201.1 aliphatic amidase expression-regulating protein [Aurantimonas sp. Leaf443]
MTGSSIPIGILFSATGSYGTVGRTMRNGALLACRQVNEAAGSGLRLDPVVVDPQSCLSAYAPAVEAMLGQGIRHVVGCYTSSSRKDVIPIFEKRDALLWYPAHYEGFESSENVVYTGSAPNHHILPLVEFLVARHGRRAFCIGSNYIWAWESNRVLRDELLQRGGSVLAERYLPVGETDMSHIVAAVLDAAPDFVFNSLIGESAYAFFRAMRRECRARGIDQARFLPIASCNLSEPELMEIGPEAIDGHLSSSVYFASVKSEANAAFVSDYARSFPDGPAASAEAEAAFVAVKLLARALGAAGTAEIGAVRRCVAGQSIEAPQGTVSIDPDTRHAYLTPRIGRSRHDGQFDILVEAKAPVRPDPYLVRSSAALEQPMLQPALRVVS